LAVSVITQQRCEISLEATKEKLDWWLDEGGDEYAIYLLALDGMLMTSQRFCVRD
jgi:hypothetical protein